MRQDDLQALIDRLPAGDWNVRQGANGARQLISAQLDTPDVLVASELSPELASFLLVARALLPELMRELEEERAHLAHLQGEHEKLQALSQALRLELQLHQVELFETTEASLTLSDALPVNLQIQTTSVPLPL